jgi:hypothetical protein
MLCAFYSKTVDSTKSHTVFGCNYSQRGNPLYYHTNEAAEASKKAPDRTKLDDELKALLGAGNLDYVTKKMDSIMRYESSIEHQATLAIKDDENRAIIDLGNGKQYQAGQVFAVFHTQLYLDYQARRPILVSARHLTHTDADMIVWNGTPLMLIVPNNKGTWDYVANPTEQQLDQVTTYCNMWHLAELGCIVDGLGSDNVQEFTDTLHKTNIPWRIFQYAAVHPSFAGRADRKVFPQEADWIKLSETVSDKYEFNEIDCSGLSFNAQMPSEKRLDLATLRACAYRAGLSIQGGNEYYNIEGFSNARLFTDQTVPLAVNHVQSNTYRKVKANIDANWNKYVAAGCPPLGRILVRHGSGALHFSDVDEAKKFDKMKPAAQKAYIAEKVCTFFT